MLYSNPIYVEKALAGVHSSFNKHDSSGWASQVTPQDWVHHPEHVHRIRRYYRGKVPCRIRR